MPQTVTTAANSFEPAQRLRVPEKDTYAKSSMAIDRLPNELQFQLARLAPDRFESPFVQNGTPLDLPVQKLVGQVQKDVAVLATDVTNYSIVFNTGYAGYYYQGTAPVNIRYYNAVGTNIPFANALNGESFSGFYGTATYYDRMAPWATIVDLELIAPAASVQGVVHVGSISVASLLGGTNPGNLIKTADSRYDLKSPEAKTIRLRSAISSREAVHKLGQTTVANWSVDDILEEYVSYAVYVNACANLNTGVPSVYSLDIAATSQALWWPDGAQPPVRGLASSFQKIETVASTHPVDLENASMLERLSHLWTTPPNMDQVVEFLLSRKSLKTVINIAEKFIPAIGVISSLFEGAPSSLMTSPQIQDDVAYLELIENLDHTRLHFKYWSPEALDLFDELEDVRSNLVNVLGAEANRRTALSKRIDAARQEVKWVHGRKEFTYYEGDDIIDLEKALRPWEHSDSEDCEDEAIVKSDSNLGFSIVPDKTLFAPTPVIPNETGSQHSEPRSFARSKRSKITSPGAPSQR